jgi:hypothetical protein
MRPPPLRTDQAIKSRERPVRTVEPSARIVSSGEKQLSTSLQSAARPGIAYENQLLGAFIYALGYESGRTGKPLPVNLFQQTPLDGTFGDLIAGGDWCVALEFKRSWPAARSERGKWPPANLQRYLEDKQMQDIAKKAHFLCFGARDQDEITIGAMRYSAFLRDPEASKGQATRGTAMVDLLVNCTGLDRQTSPLGVAPRVLESYLRRLSVMRKLMGSGEPPAQWLAVASTAQGYRIRSADSLEQLLDMPKTRSWERSAELGRTPEHKKSFDRER